MRGFVGRKRELQLIEGAVKRLRAGEPGVIEIRGDPGIGKTRLLAEAGRRAARSGVLVAIGTTGELERDVPFGVFVDALDDEVSQLDPPDGLAYPGDLGVVFPSLARLARRPADPVGVERYRLHQSVRALLERLAARRPVVLALDDLHWADEASIELLSYLLRHPPRGQVLLVLAFRPRQASSRLLGTLGEQVGLPLERLELGPLSDEEAAEFLDRRVGHYSGLALYRESGGNPLYLEALAGAVERDEPWVTSRDGARDGHEILEAVRVRLLTEIKALRSTTRAVAQAASVVGDPFEPELVATILEIGEDEVLAGLDELHACDIIRMAESPRRFRFRHPTVRRAIYGAAPAGWRLAAHGRLAQALAALEIPAAGRAHHVERAARVGDEDAVAVLVEAGEATSTTAPSTAARWFAAALRLLPATERTQAMRLRLQVALARALGTAGRLEECCGAVRDALEMARPEQSELRSELIASFGMAEHLLGRHDIAHDRLLSALDDVVDHGSPEAVALQIQLALGAFFSGDYPTMTEWARAALGSVQDMGIHALHASAAAILAVAEYSEGRIDRARTHAAKAAELVDSLPDKVLLNRLDVFLYLGQVEHSLGDFDEANRHLDRGLILSRQTGQSYLVPPLQVVKTVALVFQGRLDEASEVAETAHESALLLANQHFQTLSGVVRVWIARSRGELVEAVAMGERVLSMSASCGAMISAFAGLYLAEALLELGEADSAKDQLLMAARGPDLAPIERSIRPWGYEVLARADVMLGRLPEARQWVARAEADLEGVDYPLGWAYLHRARAHVALAEENWAGAADSAMIAAAVAEVIAVPIEAARARLLAGRALRRLGDDEAAIVALTLAEADLARCGAQRYRDEAAQELRLLGQRVPVRDRPGRPETRLGTLTRRQRDVAELVAAGQTNRQIAGGLYVSESTVETHLKHIFRKLNISSRAALAAAMSSGREPSPL